MIIRILDKLCCSAEYAADDIEIISLLCVPARKTELALKCVMRNEATYRPEVIAIA